MSAKSPIRSLTIADSHVCIVGVLDKWHPVVPRKRGLRQLRVELAERATSEAVEKSTATSYSQRKATIGLIRAARLAGM